MARYLKSETSTTDATQQTRPLSWLKVGAVAAGSALAGGLAAAWFYRNTLTKLRQADEQMQKSEFRDSRVSPDSDAD
ncbi:MAG: hypothetical protein WBF42_18165 [Terracidiphilus sp.]